MPIPTPSIAPAAPLSLARYASDLVLAAAEVQRRFDLDHAAALRHAHDAGLLADSHPLAGHLAGVLVSSRQRVSHWQPSLRATLHVSREHAFALQARPLNAGLELMFGSSAATASRIGLTVAQAAFDPAAFPDLPTPDSSTPASPAPPVPSQPKPSPDYPS